MCSRIRTVRSRIFPSSQFTSQEQSDSPGSEAPSQRVQASDQSLEIPIVVVVADKENLDTSGCCIEFQPYIRRKRSRVPREGIAIESVVNDVYLPIGPTLEFLGKC